MIIQPFEVKPHNAHYDGAYDASAMQWRKLGAIDKANNLQHVLADRAVNEVLEVGCGTGAVLAEVASRQIGHKHVGVDMADPAQHCDPAARHLDLRSYNGQKLPFDDSSFDLVYASHVVEHVPEPRQFLRELHRVARRWVYVEVPCETHMRTNVAAVQSALLTGHINAYLPEHFMVLLQTSGLDVVEFELFDHSLPVHAFGGSPMRARLKMAARRLLLRFNPTLASKVFCYHCGALARA